ncbi:hypothetical protein J2T13_004911 [Paenibacillus sp. DS2015]|uniref:ImmA/IrrE family metallo-endopeptidase n=1 Tax=Paenibacillus sp. DS2015 TaxID=3373917 RepID=UPI003D19D618
MNFSYYKETVLEQLLNELYLSNCIQAPEDLNDIEAIAESFNAEVFYDTCKPFSDNERRVIFLNIKDNNATSRLNFFHELCHVIRHFGDQRKMARLFKEAQETEADQFVLYAAIPFFMLEILPIPDRRSEAIQYIAETFQVTLKLAEQRLTQIDRRILQGQFDVLIAKHVTTTRHETAATTELPFEDGITLYAYYDSNADIPGPSQIVIEADSAAMNSESGFFFSVDGPFERLEIEDFYGYKCTQLSVNDLRYKDEQIGIDFPTISLKYGGAAKRFVVQMKDIEQVLIFENGDF